MLCNAHSDLTAEVSPESSGDPKKKNKLGYLEIRSIGGGNCLYMDLVNIGW